MNLKISELTSFVARHFPGTRKFISKILVHENVSGCTYKNIFFPFDKSLMDSKRLIAIASGSIEFDETYVAKKYFNSDDIIIELGSGLGITSSVLFNTLNPKRFICFEANQKAKNYAENLFKINNLNIEIHNLGLGSGKQKTIYLCDDYLLSSFVKPEKKQKFSLKKLNTVKINDIIKKFKPTAILCDIEGAEKDYFNPEHLFGVNKVVIELHPSIYGKNSQEKIINSFIKEKFTLKKRVNETYYFLKDIF